MDYKRSLINVKALLGKESALPKIIESCELDHVSSNWRKWTDNQGNTIIIKENKSIIINRKKEYFPKIKDLYFKSQPKSILNISSKCSILLTKSDDTTTFTFLLLGVDGKLRCCIYNNNSWLNNVAPLMCNHLYLSQVFSNLNNLSYISSLDVKQKGPIKGDVVKSWSGIWPPTQEMAMDMLLTDKDNCEKVLKECDILNDK